MPANPDNNDNNNGIGVGAGTSIGINTDPNVVPPAVFRRPLLLDPPRPSGQPIPHGPPPQVYHDNPLNNDSGQVYGPFPLGREPFRVQHPPQPVYIPADYHPQRRRRFQEEDDALSEDTLHSSQRGGGSRRRPQRRQYESDDGSSAESYYRKGRRPRRSRSSSSDSSEEPRRRQRAHGRLPRGSGLTSGAYYVPPQRGTTTTDRCYGCGHRRCQNPITVKDFDTMQNVIRTLKPEKNFEGAKDDRSGTTWVAQMHHETEGHPDVVRYLWLKRYTSAKVWNEVTGGMIPPTRCYHAYERQVKKIIKQLRKTFDTDEHLHKTEHTFNNCAQGKGSVYDFVERLEDLSTELYHLGSPVLEYKLKWKLYNGLNNNELRLRVNDHLDDKEVSYAEFKEVVLRQHRRMTNAPDRKDDGERDGTSRRDGSQGSYGRRYSPNDRRPWQRQPYRKREDSIHSVERADDDYTTDGEGSSLHHVNMGRDLSGLKCYRCLRRGHSAKECSQDQPADLATRCRICGNPRHTADACRIKSDRLHCYRCDQPGHLAYVCTSKNSKSKSSSSRRTPTPRLTSSVDMIIDAGRGQVQLPRHVHTTTTSPRRQTTSYSAPMMMVIGNVKVEGTVTPALFDTGAEVSLITESALRRLAPDAIVTSSITRHIAVADGGALQVNGTTRLTVSTDKIAIDDEFIVITDDLSVPVLLGCPTLGKLKTTIQINPEGMHVITNDEHDFSPYEPEKMVRFAQPGEGELSDDRDREYILTSYKINHVHQLFLRQDKYTTTLPNGMLEDIIYSDANIFPQDSFLGRADCNHSGKDPTTKYYVHYAATPPTTTTTKDSMTPHKIDDIMEKEEEDADVHSDDNLPPWEVLIRQWIQDDSTPLGRACVRVPWLNDERPPFNFKNAAERGAASVRRLTPDQRQSFEAALQAYVERGFCVIVKDNNVGGRHSIPTFNECQDAWDAMTRGTALEGTVVIKPYHFTPSHMVFRDHHPTTPCRIVLDFRKLNQFAARGGKSQNDLQGVLLQLRSFRYFISADVSKAFCQMKASLYDVGYSSYTCIGNYTVLWSSIAFGSNNAPCMLEASTHDVVTEIHGLVQTAKDNMTGPREDLTTEEPPRLSYMQVERALLRPSATGVEYILRGPKIPLRMFLLKYVDDLFFGARTKEGVCESYDFGSYVFGGHGFKSDPVKNFCNWLVSEDDHDLKKSVLGYVLRLSQDKFHAVYSGHVPEGRVTKLQACAALASLYDPLGLYVELGTLAAKPLDVRSRVRHSLCCDGGRINPRYMQPNT